jgi:hypothetical protein
MLRGWGQKGSRPQAWFQNNWEPSFTCLHERRIGGNGDGPKWVCDPHRIDPDNCLVYSFGSNNEFSFEEAILRDISAKCEIHTFDPTIGPTPSSECSLISLSWIPTSSWDQFGTQRLIGATMMVNMAVQKLCIWPSL